MGKTTTFKDRLKTWARQLRVELVAVSRAARDPRTPWAARIIILFVVAYAASPIDLIPDFIPVLGLVDDLIIVPLGLALALRLIPPEVIAEHRAAAAEQAHVPPSRAGFAIVVALWLAALLVVAIWVKRRW